MPAGSVTIIAAARPRWRRDGAMASARRTIGATVGASWNSGHNWAATSLVPAIMDKGRQNGSQREHGHDAVAAAMMSPASIPKELHVRRRRPTDGANAARADPTAKVGDRSDQTNGMGPC